MSFLAGPILGIIAALIASIFSYQIAKYAYFTLQSRIHSHDDGLTITLPDKDISRFLWSEITYAGEVIFTAKRISAFVYSELHDTYIEILPIYEGFDELLRELEKKCPFGKYEPTHSETIKELISNLIAGKPV